jgi:phosphoenolpyruvate-protein phosphotransferase
MKGIGVSAGMAYARAYLVEDNLQIEKHEISDVGKELQRFSDAVEKAKKQVEGVKREAVKDCGEENAEIFEFQILMLENEDFIKEIKNYVENFRVNCEYALNQVMEAWIRRFSELDNVYLRERTIDVIDVFKRLKSILLGREAKSLNDMSGESIIIADDLTPSQAIGLNRKNIKGMAMAHGGSTSHTTIIARALGIPCVVGIPDLMENVKTGEPVLIDGDKGEIFLSPTAQKIEEMKIYERKAQKEKEELIEFLESASITEDGFKVNLLANISSKTDADTMLEYNGDGVGLFRTEFLYMADNTPPTEEKQFEVYDEIAKSLGTKPLIIRTLDVGGDKKISYLNIGEEENPFLGFRAIRYCLENKELFKAQLAAILRSGTETNNVKLMFPMISTLDELRQSKAILQEVKEELGGRQVPFNREIEVGVMIETPAAAMMAERFAMEADFLSIGTNDLIQYVFAADRMNAKVSYLNSYFHPLLFRLIKHIKDSAAKYGKSVEICGQAAEISYLVPLWIAMGIDTLSVSPSSILKLRKLICGSNRETLRTALDKVLTFDHASQVENYLKACFDD